MLNKSSLSNQPLSPSDPGLGGWIRSLGLGGFFLEGYLLKELIRPFFLGVAGGTVLLLGNQLFLYTDLLVKKGAPPIMILQILILNLPAILVVSFPIAGLFATLLTLGRMGADSEITALRSAGISYRQLFVPILCIGLMISALAFWMNDYIVPSTNQKVRTLNENLFLTKDILLLNTKEIVRIDDNLWVYIGEINQETGQMRDVLILDRKSETGLLRYPQVITAKTAIRQAQTWQLQDAVVRRYDQEGRTYYEGKVGNMDLNLAEQLRNLVRGDPVPQEQSTQQLRERIQTLEKDPQHDKREAMRLKVELSLKYTIPLASFFAILIASPLGIQAVRKTGRYGGVAVAIVLVFVYFVLLSLGRSLGRAGMLDPSLSAWLPNLIFGGLGSVLLWRYVR